MEERIKILLVEDDKVDQMAFKRFVEREHLPYDYQIAGSVSEAREVLATERFDAVLIDYLLGDGTAFDLFDDLGDAPGIVITGSGDEEIAVKAMKAGAYDYLVKDPQGHYLTTLPVTVENVISRRGAEEELKLHREHLEELVEGRTAELAMANEQLLAEIAERKRAEEALRESGEKYRTILESIEESYYEVDIAGNFTFFNDALCRLLGYPEDELMGMNNRQYMDDENARKVYQTFNAVYRAGKPARAFDWEVIRKDATRRFVESSVSLIRDPTGEPAGFRGIVRDVTERLRAEEELQQSYAKLQRALEGTAAVLVSAIEMRDPYTAGHQRRVTGLACAIAREMGLPQEQIEGLRMAGLIHDIGKITIPAEILSKPGQLNDIEWGLLRAHSQAGYNVLKTVDFPWPVAEIVLQHHERLDGSGYPQELSGAGILMKARILAVADVVEAMSSHRPYRPARGLDEALEEISQNRGVLYDADVVDACLKLFAENRFEFE